MQYAEITQHVQSMAQTKSQDEAEQAIRATLETLAERILGDEASHLADQLPEEYGQCLRGHEGQTGEAFSLKEFYERVGQREGIEPITAAKHVRAVMAVLNSAITPGEFEDVQANLSDDYNELFAATRTMRKSQ